MSTSNSARSGLILSVVLLGFILIGLAYGQRPQEYDPTGAAYLRVNINPTDVPPMVNINPYQSVPRVRVTEMPEIRVPPTGCENRRNYLTGIGRSISGPVMITYLHLPEQTRVTLNGDGSHSINLGSSGQIRTAIFLQANQRMDFDSEIMYSGCRPD
jgi:hypothetical protein